ncbi:poly-beta-1,6-N-acetyl-D-glucosamine biosynthesis protein PgaD [Terribacillus sp. DMT04]|uniref:poly-beta-1,6-N-acetyl-D-glucosamine biosynthesis protein PgaD n=1 Tax=Terribacillus sp. DMT04 TaxID=2850441 RepID=UPI001C2BFC8A|nr:poly-beta-1,6-N-acetyl-D-glucosamine biosynthesis protein PgaD [Terribacillus sp. DMT04]QXE02752.1 poly-beta-1,6-N-acetyl-D-glucosamine biosynthesis protein PgaD [Terribacillus sp. DMT04]
MEKPRPRDRQEQVIILEKQPLPRFLVSLFFTLLIWIYSVFVVWFFASALLNTNDRYSGVLKIAFKTSNAEVRTFMLIGVSIFLAFLLYFLFWRTYNKKRFGNKSRRKQPMPVTVDDLEKLELMPLETIKKLQASNYMEFHKNPVRDLEK